jgi:hypothetical protein
MANGMISKAGDGIPNLDMPRMLTYFHLMSLYVAREFKDPTITSYDMVDT